MNANDLYQFDRSGALLQTHLPLPRRSGKVRDVYDLGDELLIVSTDRISAFDTILPNGIPGKGSLLTAMSVFWFGSLDTPHHLIGDAVPDDLQQQFDAGPLRGRVMVTRKCNVVPFECVVRGYLEGSGWREYQQTAAGPAGPIVGGHALPTGLRQCDRLPQPIFTPSTKAVEGHDQNVTLSQMAETAGETLTHRLRDRSIDLYNRASQHASQRGIIIADTKFEFGRPATTVGSDGKPDVGDNDGDGDGGELILIDEVLTPDSSRFWSADRYRPGAAQPSMDKQFVREFLMASDWDRHGPPPVLPDEVVAATAEKYQQAHDRLTS